MSTHSLADAKDRLSELIDRALEGENVTITRHGAPVVELKPVPNASEDTQEQPVHTNTKADIDWLRAHRVPRLALGTDAGTLVSNMRDEDWR